MAKEQHSGVLVRNCTKASVEEAKKAQEQFPDMKLTITNTTDYGTCIEVCPLGFHPDTEVNLSGHPEILRKIMKNGL